MRFLIELVDTSQQLEPSSQQLGQLKLKQLVLDVGRVFRAARALWTMVEPSEQLEHSAAKTTSSGRW